MATVILKGARVQKVLVALLYLVSMVCGKFYIVCATLKILWVLCTLALLHPWVQAQPQPSDSSPIFGPCWPRVAVLRAGWGRNRSPPIQARVGPHKGDSESARACGADIFLFCKCSKLGIRSRLCPTKNLPFGGGQAERSSDVVGRHVSGQ